MADGGQSARLIFKTGADPFYRLSSDTPPHEQSEGCTMCIALLTGAFKMGDPFLPPVPAIVVGGTKFHLFAIL